MTAGDLEQACVRVCRRLARGFPGEFRANQAGDLARDLRGFIELVSEAMRTSMSDPVLLVAVFARSR